MTSPGVVGPSHGLVIREPWIRLILAGEKTWELLVVGEAQVQTVHGPLAAPDLERHADRHRVTADQLLALSYPQVYAWELAEVMAYPTPRPYDHPRGAIIWVKLDRS